MDRKSLRKMIQQEIARVKEDYLVPREEVPPDFVKIVPAEEDPHDDDVQSYSSHDLDASTYNCKSNYRVKKLTCASCGDPLVMEGGCGCGSSDSEVLFSMSPTYDQSSSCPSCGSSGGCACKNDKKTHAYMAKPQLHKIEKYASELQEMIPDGHDLEDWMRTKISQAADDLSEVYHKLEYKSHLD